MMHHDGVHRGTEWMHWGGMLVWLLLVILLILAIAALVKYLRGPGR